MTTKPINTDKWCRAVHLANTQPFTYIVGRKKITDVYLSGFIYRRVVLLDDMSSGNWMTCFRIDVKFSEAG